MFRGRYKSVLIDKENYFLNASRYIHKNPSEAEVTKDDQKYPWSSYQYYSLNKLKKPKWLITSETLNYFDGDREEYVKFVERGIDEDCKKFYSSKNIKFILGKKSFIKEISEKWLRGKRSLGKEISSRGQIIAVQYPSLDELLLRVVQKYQINPDYVLKNEARNYVFERSLLIYLLMFNPRYSLVEKGKFLGMSDDGISKSYKRFLDKLELNKNMREEVESIKKEIYG